MRNHLLIFNLLLLFLLLLKTVFAVKVSQLYRRSVFLLLRVVNLRDDSNNDIFAQCPKPNPSMYTVSKDT